MGKTTAIFAVLLGLGVPRSSFTSSSSNNSGRSGQLTPEEKAPTWSFTWTNPVPGAVSTYYVVEEAQDFFAAETQCNLQFRGHLAAPSTQAENEHIRLKISERFGFYLESGRLWFGMIKRANWEFVNGETSHYSNWHPGEPSGDGECAEFHGEYNWEWNDIPCNNKYLFI